MDLTNEIEFQDYLQALSTTRFENWWGCFIYTDAAEQVPLKPVSSESFFEFDLMVELEKPPPKDSQQQPQKTEIHPVLEGIRKYAANHVLLIGRPGSGKTTALQRLLIEEAKNTLTQTPPK